MTARPLFRNPEHEPIRVSKLNDLNERPLQINFEGKPDAGQVLWRGKSLRPLWVKDIQGDSDNAASGVSVVTLTADGTTVATATWGASQTKATGAIPSPAIAATATLKLTAPASQDATLANATVWITFGEG